MLTTLDRIYLSREIILRSVGENNPDWYAGPLFWNAPDNAMAQIVSRMPFPQLIAHMPTLSIIAQLLNATEYLNNKDLAPSVWAEKRQVSEGLLNPVYLSSGVGEGLGLARMVGIPAYDYDCITVYEAITAAASESISLAPAEKGARLRDAWSNSLRDKELSYAGYAMTALMYAPHFGAGVLIDMIDSGIFTRESLKRLKAGGFATAESNGMELQTMLKYIKG